MLVQIVRYSLAAPKIEEQIIEHEIVVTSIGFPRKSVEYLIEHCYAFFLHEKKLIHFSNLDHFIEDKGEG